MSLSSESSIINESNIRILILKDCSYLNSLYYEYGRLKWTKNLESLKKFFDDGLGLQGKWTSPGGDSKKFKCHNLDVIVIWYHKKQQTLTFHGKNGDCLRSELINLIESSNLANEQIKAEEVIGKDSMSSPTLIDTPEIGPNSEIKRNGFLDDGTASLRQCNCPCHGLTVEIEGIKLDIVILQNQFENQKACITNNTHAVTDLSSLNKELVDSKERCMILENDIAVIVRNRNDEVKELYETITSLTDKITKAEEERDSLRLALKIIMDEKNAQNANPASEVDHNKPFDWHQIPPLKNSIPTRQQWSNYDTDLVASPFVNKNRFGIMQIHEINIEENVSSDSLPKPVMPVNQGLIEDCNSRILDCSVTEILNEDEGKVDPATAFNVIPERLSVKEKQEQQSDQVLDNRIKTNHSVLRNANEDPNDGATIGQNGENKRIIEDQINRYRLQQKSTYEKWHADRHQTKQKEYKQPKKAPRRMQLPFRERFVHEKSRNRSKFHEADWLNYLQYVRRTMRE